VNFRDTIPIRPTTNQVLCPTEYQRIVEEGLWDKELIDQVMKYGRIEETSAVYLSKLRKEE